MKIIVTTKRVPDTDQKIRIGADGVSIDDGNIPYVVNPFDAIAVEEAIRIREGSDDNVEIVAVGIGSDAYESELRTALAMGADRAILVESDEALESWNVAKIACAIIERENPDLVLMGKQAVDDDANQTGQFVAAILDWPIATFASKLEFSDSSVRVFRETDAGIEVVVVDLPAVITSDLRLNEPRYASLPSILKARKKSIERISLEQLGVTIEPRIRVLNMQAVLTGRNCVRVENAAELVKNLREEKVI